MKHIRLMVGAFIAMCMAWPAQAQTYTESVLYSFCNQGSCASGELTDNGLLQGSDGDFYGTTEKGGANFYGTVFKITPSGTLTTLHTFCSQSDCSDGASPNELVQGSDGNFYGTTSEAGSKGGGTVFKITPSGVLTTLYTFCSQNGCTDGEEPTARLVEGSDGNYYGSTAGGGNGGGGTVFKITPAGTLTTLYAFCSQTSCTDGNEPSAALVERSSGNFYGTTGYGGANNSGCSESIGCGTVFGIASSGTLSILYSFCSQTNCTDGDFPYAGLVEGSDGDFYGTTNSNGNNEYGVSTVFKITPSGTLATLYTFCSQTNCADSNFPYASLFEGSDGNFYGTASGDGPTDESGYGVAFKITPLGTLTTLYTFCSQAECTDGLYPHAGLVQSSNGSFYGTTEQGGANTVCADGDGVGCGTVYEIAVAPALPAPVQLSLSSNSIALGASVEVTYKVLNAFSLSAQQCYGFSTLNGETTAVGKVTGTLTDGVYGGSANVTFPAAGVYHLALTCGGVESGFATLTVNGLPTTSTLTASPNPATVGQAVTLTTTVTGSKATPTGTVTFYYGSDALDTVALNSSGVASFTASSTGLPAGTYAIHAVYSGSVTYAASTSPAVNVKLEAAQ